MIPAAPVASLSRADFFSLRRTLLASSLALLFASPAFAIDNPQGSVIYTTLGSDSTPVVTNGGTVDTTGTVSGSAAIGILAGNTGMGDTDVSVVNSGSVTTSGNNHPGIQATSTGNGSVTVTNLGNISTSGDNGYGISAFSYSGDVSVIHSGAGHISTSGNFGYGIYAISSSGDVSVVHAGAGIISTSGNNGHGIYASSDSGTVSVANAGTIVVSGSGSHGMMTSGSATVSNTGFISATGPGSHELHVLRGTTNVTTWATMIDPRRVTFGVDSAATLRFDTTHLVLKPGEPGSGFVFGRDYAIRDGVEVASGGNVSGSVGSVSSLMPMMEARLSGDAVDNQRVSLFLDSSRSYGQQANVAAVRNMQNRMWLTNRTLSSALANAYAAPDDSSVFAQSYYLNAGSSGEVASSSDSLGFVFGGTKRIYPDFLLGFHAGYEHTDMQADSAGLKGDSDSWLLGLHGAYYVAPSAFVRAQLTGSVSRSEYDFAMTGDASSDKRTEYAVFANVTGGYDFQVNEANTITPEVGLAYLYMKNPSMDARWHNAYNRYMDVQVESESYQAAFATAALRWTGAFTQQSTSVKPTVALGVRQTLTDGEIDGGMRFVGNRYGSYVTDDKTVGTVEAGLQFQQKNMTMAVKYNGSFGPDTHDNVVWGEIGFAF